MSLVPRAHGLMNRFPLCEKSRIFSKYLTDLTTKSPPGSRSSGSLGWLHNFYHVVLKGLPFETILLNGRMRPKNVLKD